MTTAPKILLIGISGPSSSGKTTLSRLLRDIFPSTIILHEDDFYKSDNDIPTNSRNGLADWDCIESINLPALEKALAYIKQYAQLPLDLESKEDKNDVGESGVDKAVVEEMREKARTVRDGAGPEATKVAIIDGFLLYSDDMEAIRQMFDVKLFLRTDYKTAKSRREARSGYVTLEGFWEDPPGYVDQIVWPNYVKDHAALFKDGNVEEELDEAVCSKLEIDGMPRKAQGNMTTCLEWAYGIVEKALTEARMR